MILWKKHVFIIGSKGIPAQYGGFESFVENLTKYRKDKEIQYYVSCIPTKEVIQSPGLLNIMMQTVFM